MASLASVSLAEGTPIFRSNQRSRAHRLQACCRWENSYSASALGFGQLSSHPRVRSLRHFSLHVFCCPPLSTTGSFPSLFRLQVAWVLQAPPSECLPFCARDTIERDAAHTEGATSRKGAVVNGMASAPPFPISPWKWN